MSSVKREVWSVKRRRRVWNVMWTVRRVKFRVLSEKCKV